MRQTEVPPNTEPFQVVHVAETVRGGIATYLRVLLPLQLGRYGTGQVAVVLPSDGVADLEPPSGVCVEPFRPGGRRSVRAMRARASMLRLLRERGARVVHLHSSYAGLFCRIGILFVRRRPRVVYCAHGWAFDRGSRLNFVFRYIEKLMARRTDAIVCISDHDRRSAVSAGIDTRKLVVVRNGLPDYRGSSAPDASWNRPALRLLFVGRLDRQKGLDILLAALKKVDRPVQLHVFGEQVLNDGPQYAADDDVEFHGWADFATIAPYLKTCHALVVPSRWEGLGIAAIEAMRAGKAVIASRVGGLPEIVRDGITGILVAPADVGAWAAGIQSLKVDELERMGIQSRELFLQEFSVDRVEASLADLYSSILRTEGGMPSTGQRQ